MRVKNNEKHSIRYRYRHLFRILLLVLLTYITYESLVAFVDQRLVKNAQVDIISTCHKVWSSRGLVTDVANRWENANSIESIGLAIKSGAKGVEVDMFYDSKMNDYIVSHDRPYNLKNGKLLTLSELFEALNSDVYIWLDFKKLTRLDGKELEHAVERLTKITSGSGMNKRIYVESEHPIKLSAFHQAGFQTLLDTQPLPESYIGTEFVHNLYKIVYYFSGHSAMGISFGSLENPVFNSTSERVLKNIPLFIYHVPNNELLIRRLSKLPNVKAILNTNDTVDMFSISSCDN